MLKAIYIYNYIIFQFIGVQCRLLCTSAYFSERQKMFLMPFWKNARTPYIVFIRMLRQVLSVAMKSVIDSPVPRNVRALSHTPIWGGTRPYVICGLHACLQTDSCEECNGNTMK